MRKKADRTEVLLWASIALLIGLVYSTLSIVPLISKGLVDRYGPGIFGSLNWVFVSAGLALAINGGVRFRGTVRVRSLFMLALIAGAYAYFLSTTRFGVERVHFLEYGLLGALLYHAFRCRNQPIASGTLALTAAYWIGLGDETIQWLLPNRVGEIGDGVLNLFSGALGIAVVALAIPARATGAKDDVRPALRVVCGAIATSAVLTACFVGGVHGFGYQLESTDPGRVFTSLSPPLLGAINKADPSVSPRDRATYEDEALRHLHQREFYFTTDYRAEDGSSYRSYDRCFFENRILEVYFPRFLRDRAATPSSTLLERLAPETARTTTNPVLWPDSVRTWVEAWGRGSTVLHESRVKSTIIVGFGPGTLAFYVIAVIVLMGLAYVQAGTGTPPPRDRRTGTNRFVGQTGPTP